MDRKELLKRAKERTEKNDKFIDLLGIKIVDIDEGYCRGEMVIESKHLNPMGTVHGGCLYALADTIGGFASSTLGMANPTLSGNMYFLRPTLGVNKLICESRVIKNGKRIRVSEVTIYGDNGEEIARCLLEYMDPQRNLLVND